MVRRSNSRKQAIYLFIGVFLTSLIIAASIVNANAENIITKTKQGQVLSVKIPDGIYLHFTTFNKFRKNIWSPLIIIKDKQILDPYEVANELGVQKIVEEYIVGKTFNVFKGSEKIGELSDVTLDSYNRTCMNKPYDAAIKILSEIEGSGKYKGKPLAIEKIDNTRKWPVGVLDIIAAPTSFPSGINIKNPILTENDQMNMVNAVRKNFRTMVWKECNKELEKEGRYIESEYRSYLFLAEAVDLTGSGNKDFLGIYYFHYKTATIKSSANKFVGSWGMAVPFVLWSNGKIEKLNFLSSVTNYSFIAAVDIYGDGIKELIIQKRVDVPDDTDHIIETKVIEILQHKDSGWQTIWKSGLVCFSGSSFYLE
ncbi:MAG: hypothetical protein WC364_14135 [Eubacteriales bacterium]|jgi:hypothetical protein